MWRHKKIKSSFIGKLHPDCDPLTLLDMELETGNCTGGKKLWWGLGWNISLQLEGKLSDILSTCACVLTLFFRQRPLCRQVFPGWLDLVWSHFPNLSTHDIKVTPQKNTASDSQLSYRYHASVVTRWSQNHKKVQRVWLNTETANTMYSLKYWPPALCRPCCENGGCGAQGCWPCPAAQWQGFG